MIKVFQWASGTVGQHAARQVVGLPGCELVGLHAVSADKVGRDAGEVLGLETLGVPATGTLDAVADSSADLVLHMPLASQVYGERPEQDLDDICTLLAAGKDVITVVGYLYPPAHGGEVVAQLQDACRQGGSTFHSTGLNPGWMGDLLPVVMAGLARDVGRIVVREITNFEFYPSPEIMFESMGFGSTPAVFEQQGARRRHWLDGLFRENILLVAEGVGLTLDDVHSEVETALAPEALETAAGLVAEGTVAGQHWTWSGVADGEARVVHETVWRMHRSVAPDWPQGNHTVTVEGTPAISIDFKPTWISDGLMATAMHAVNAIPAVVAAEPGICTLLDLPRALRRR